MNSNLEKTMKDYERRIQESADRGLFDLFTVHKIADFIYLHTGQNTVLKLLKNAADAEPENLTIAQISGILQAYASVLEPVLEPGIERITEACKFEGNILTISENDTFLSVNQAVETGIALLRYGRLTENETLEKAGYAIVNSYLAESSSFDLRTLSNLYPVIAYDNLFYPHLEKVSDDGGSTVWAWTYDMSFRTDPRFETYNSSGYVYKKNTETLLLKSRHKSQLEKIRLVYRVAKPAAAPVVETTPEPAASTEETAPAAAPAVTEPAPAPAEEEE